MEQRLQDAVKIVELSDQFNLLKRVPEELTKEIIINGALKKVAFIDLETTGLDPLNDEIIEIGLLIVSYNDEGEFVAVDLTSNQLQEPRCSISEEITNVTGITNEEVKGQTIDWQELAIALSGVDLIICHNASFDRNFMELQTPSQFSDLIKSKAFGCSAKDVDWMKRGFGARKLEYLNFKMGYFYAAHRALVDCWATFNIFVQCEGTFDELLDKVQAKEFLIYAENTPYEQKDDLKSRGYRWNNGDSGLPKSWWINVHEDLYQDEVDYLKNYIYKNNKPTLTIKVNTALERHSYRV